MPSRPEPRDFERWTQRFEEESPIRRAAMVGDSAVRLAAGFIDRALKQAAATVADARRAFNRELDPTMEDAKVLEEWDDTFSGKPEVGRKIRDA